MKDGLVTLLGLVMVAYVLYLGVVTIAFLPLAGGFFYGHIGAYYVSLILISAAALTFNFLQRRELVAGLALTVLLIAVCYWWFAEYGGPWAWSIFYWSALPAMVFAACGVVSWLLGRHASNQPEPQPETDEG